MRARVRAVAFTLISMLVCGGVFAQAPHLRAQGSATQLIVDGEPFLILGGELGNSTASDLDYLKPYWAKLKALHLNTVLAPVSWELIEPVEGRFDFSSVDGLLRDARASELRLVLLWFGSYKNSMSTYVPGWVKRQQSRFPRAKNAHGESEEILSAFSPNNWTADAKAFEALMAHLREVDSKQRTVIMVQVENEVGMLPTAREHGEEANRRFEAPVDPELLSCLSAHRAQLVPQLRTIWEANGARTEGNWRAVFGTGAAADEIFTAWHFARFVEQVAAAGKRAYSLPLFVNAAQNRPGLSPGEYPSGGPLPHLLDVWKAGAPSIDFISPDIYSANFEDVISKYARPGNPLFVPEANRAGRAESGAEAYLAIGRYDAIGYSPFSIESISDSGMHRLADAFDTLRQLTPTILAAQGHDRMVGLMPPISYESRVTESPETVSLGDYTFEVSYVDPWVPKAEQTISSHGGLIVQTGPEEYFFAGSGLTITASPARSKIHKAGIESAWEGRFENGEWQPGRLMNGDQTHQGRHIRLEPDRFSVQKVTLYRYE